MAIEHDVPRVRGTAIVGLTAAAHELWGERGVRLVAERLPYAVRKVLLEDIVTTHDWVPEDHLIHLCAAVWEGPAERVDAAFRSFLGRSVFHGFGRFQRLLLGMVSPSALNERAPALWRRDHTHGDLTSDTVDGRTVFRLRGHPYVETEFARDMFAETLRSIVAMLRVARAPVRERHLLEGADTVAVHVTWG